MVGSSSSHSPNCQDCRPWSPVFAFKGCLLSLPCMFSDFLHVVGGLYGLGPVREAPGGRFQPQEAPDPSPLHFRSISLLLYYFTFVNTVLLFFCFSFLLFSFTSVCYVFLFLCSLCISFLPHFQYFACSEHKTLQNIFISFLLITFCPCPFVLPSPALRRISSQLLPVLRRVRCGMSQLCY